MTERISVSPDPMRRGESARVCYEFDGLPATEVHLHVTWTPGGTQTITITNDADPACTDLDVPDDALAVVIVDGSGQSEDYAGAVDPPA